MGVYISGMDIPQEGRITIQIGANSAVYTVTQCKIIAENYEKGYHVIEVPEPHGRLINADLIMDKLKESCRTVFGDDDDIPECSGLSIVSDYIESAPTVIQASEEVET